MLSKYLQNRRLFRECIEALDPNVSILSDEETDKILNLFEQKAPIYHGGSRIDWRKVRRGKAVDSPQNIINSLNELMPNLTDYSVYVFWNDASLPVIKTDLETIIKSYDDVVSVGFETWMYNPQEGYLVEHYYLGEIRVGLIG